LEDEKMARTTRFIGSAGLIVVLAGCSTYSPRYRFTPVLAEFEVDAPGRENASVRAIAAVRGVRRADPDELIGESVEVRLRLENATGAPVTVTDEGLELLSGDLQSFARPHLKPGRTSVVSPGDSLLVTAWFPFPDGASRDELDLSTLILHWRVHLDDEAISGRATFSGTRVRRYPCYGRARYPCYGGHYFFYPRYHYRHRYGRGHHGHHHGFHGRHHGRHH
jgi:hypothetical protein